MSLRTASSKARSEKTTTEHAEHAEKLSLNVALLTFGSVNISRLARIIHDSRGFFSQCPLRALWFLFLGYDSVGAFAFSGEGLQSLADALGDLVDLAFRVHLDQLPTLLVVIDDRARVRLEHA